MEITSYLFRQKRRLNNKKMKTTCSLIILALVSTVLLNGCKKDDNDPVETNKVSQQQTIHLPVSMGTKASTLAVLAGTTITNTGATAITGNMALSPGSSVGGFPPGNLYGTLHINDNVATQAQLDLTAAYNDAAGRTAVDMVLLAGNIGGLTLTPGLYKSTSTLAISSGNLTFDALGNEDAVFIIQIASSFNMTSGRQVFLSGGAKASNIFWQIGSSATFGTTAAMKGTVMVLKSISFKTGASLDGKALARNGAVTMEGNTIVRK